METMDCIRQHRSIRKYKSTPVEDNVLNQVLEAASRASTTGNMQVYSIVVTRDEEKKKALLPFHFGQQMVVEAPVILTFCADFHRFNQWCKMRKAEPGYDNFLSFYTASIDALLAAQNASLAAESFGLGICYLGTTTYMAEPIAKVLELPEGVVPVTTVVLGYTDESPELTDRLPMESIVHYEKYEAFDREKIDRVYVEKESMDFYKTLPAENDVETLAQVFTEKRYKKADNVLFSQKFLKFIEQQGFMNNE